MVSEMTPGYSKRDYLLPKGCKDLIDVLKLEHKQHRETDQVPISLPQLVPLKVLPPVKGELLVPDDILVKELAPLLKCKPFVVIADLMELGIFAQLNQLLDFPTVSKVLRKHGYIAKKIGSLN